MQQNSNDVFNISNLKSRLQSLRNDVNKAVGERDVLVRKKNDKEGEISESKDEIGVLKNVRTVMSYFTKVSEQRIKQRIEPVITNALQFIFDTDELFFHLSFVERRNQNESDFFVLRSRGAEQDYQEWLRDPESNKAKIEQLIKDSRDINFMYGGSVNQVVSIVMRLLILELTKSIGPVAFDEPSGAMSEQHNARLGQLLSTFSEKSNRQIVLVTHSHALSSHADKQYYVDKSNNVSYVREGLGE